MGKFIIIEGPDFCGKSTQINLLDIGGYFRDKEIFFTREPGSFLPESDEVCEKIRDKILNEDNTPFDEAMLFAESRYYHTKDIVRLMNKYEKGIIGFFINKIINFIYRFKDKKQININVPVFNKKSLFLQKEVIHYEIDVN